MLLEPETVRLSDLVPRSHDAGVSDREAALAGVRWALVEYGPGSARADWCSTPHSGYVLAGSVRYEFEDGRAPLLAEAGAAFLLPSGPRHRGGNSGPEEARLFLIDSLPAAAAG